MAQEVVDLGEEGEFQNRLNFKVREGHKEVDQDRKGQEAKEEASGAEEEPGTFDSLISKTHQRVLSLPSFPTPSEQELPVGGRLSHFWKRWEDLGLDKWIVSILKEGYKISFQEIPPLSRQPILDSKETAPFKIPLLEEEIHQMLIKEAIEEVENLESPGYYSRPKYQKRKEYGDP